MKVLVTGAGGFIGSRVLKIVQAKGWTAWGTSRFEGTSLVRIDIADNSSLTKLRSIGPFDAVINCAGIAHRSGDVAESEYERVNIGGTKNVAEFAAEIGVANLIHLSSVLVYGRHGVDISETEDCAPRDAYAMSKLGSEDAAAEICTSSGIALTIFRPAPVIGEGCKGNFQRLIKAIDRGRFINVGSGSNRKSMIYVDDVAAACIRVLEERSGAGVERYNLASGPIAVREILASVYDALGKRATKFSIPSGPLISAVDTLRLFSRNSTVDTAARSLETWVSDDVYSAEAIRTRFGFTARVPIEEAIRRTLAAYKGGVSG